LKFIGGIVRFTLGKRGQPERVAVNRHTANASRFNVKSCFVNASLAKVALTTCSIEARQHAETVRKQARLIILSRPLQCLGRVCISGCPLPLHQPISAEMERANAKIERLLEAVGHVLASSAYNLGLQQALRRALAQAVTAREEERRRIRREIHDGIGPLLAAALLRTETAMDLPSGSLSQAESLLKLHQLQKTAVTDIRSLVEGLRPPALDHGGLLSALQQHADLSADMAMPESPTVSFEVAGDLSVLPAAVEVAAYRIAQEAISNATKHAGAQRLTVRLSRTDNGLTVEIDDDGIGVGVGADTNPSGVGLASMSERATELGGWCTNGHSPRGGTRVKAWLPILIDGSVGNA
jgi:signal transduction histidine kinase